jgi:hypothetical protein
MFLLLNLMNNSIKINQFLYMRSISLYERVHPAFFDQFSMAAELGVLYNVENGECITESVYKFRLKGENVTFGIPKFVPRVYHKTLHLWAEKVLKWMHKHRKDPYHLVEVVYSPLCRLVFDFKYNSDNGWEPSDIHQASEIARCVASSMFNVSGVEPVSIYRCRTKKFVRAVFPCSKVQLQDLRSMRDCTKVVALLREHDVILFDEGGSDGLEIPVVGSNCGKVFSQMYLSKDDKKESLLQSLCAPVYPARPEPKTWKVNDDVVAEITIRRREEQQRQRRERSEELQRTARVYNEDLWPNLGTPDRLDERKLMEMFEDPEDPEYVLYINKYVAHIAGSKSHYCVKEEHYMTGQMYFLEVPDNNALLQKYSNLQKKIQVEDAKGNIRATKVHIMRAWLEHPDHLKLCGSFFMPGKPTVYKGDIRQGVCDSSRPLYLNLFTDFAYKVYLNRYTDEQLYVPGPSLSNKPVVVNGRRIIGRDGLLEYMSAVGQVPVQRRQYLDILLEHIFRVYCSGNVVMFWAFNAFFYNLIMHPEKKCPASLVLKGTFGVGKSIFIQGVGKYALGYGTLYQYLGGDGVRLTNRFNSDMAALLIFIDEAEYMDPSSAGKIKSLITEETVMREKKFGLVKMDYNFSNLIYAGNSFAGEIFPGDRRFWCMECDPSARMHITGDKAVRESLSAACGNNEAIGPLGILQYVLWLRGNKEDFERFDFRENPYMTPYKKQHIMKCMAAVHQWWRDILTSGKQPVPKTYSYAEGYVPIHAPLENDCWNGETTWGILWGDFKSKYHKCGKLTKVEFEQLVSRCVVLKEEEVRQGVVPKAHENMPLYFGCLSGCLAQFDVFLNFGSVADSAVTCRGQRFYEDAKWVKELFYQDIKSKRQGGCSADATSFHDRCQLCSHASKYWSSLSQCDIETVRREARACVEEEEKGILPAIYYKPTEEANQQVPAAQVRHGSAERAEDHGIYERQDSSEEDDFEWELRGAVDREC